MRSLVVPRLNVTVILRGLDGSIVEVIRAHNAACQGFADLLGQAAADNLGAATLALSHVSLGMGGQAIDLFETTSGWTGSPVLDTSSFREGSASLKRTVSASTSATITSPAKTLDLSAETQVEIWVKVDTRADLDTTTEAIRLVTSGGNYYSLTWDDLETANGAPLVDGTWSRILVSHAAFTETGSPDWATITALACTVTANASGAVTAWWDGCISVPATVSAATSATAITGETSVIAVVTLEDLGSGQARAKAFWNATQAVGVHRQLGLYANGGRTLSGIVAPTPIVKTSLLTLTVEWVLSCIAT